MKEIEPKGAALSHVLKVVASRSGQAVMYTTALLGTAALVPGMELEGVLGVLAGGIGVEAIGILLERVAHGEGLSEEEIIAGVEEAIAESGIEQLLTQDSFYHAFAHLRRGQRTLRKDFTAVVDAVHRLEAEITESSVTAAFKELRADYLDYLRRRYAYLDLGGIAPKVANRTVKLAMQDTYVPVEARRELDVEAQLRKVADLLKQEILWVDQVETLWPESLRIRLLEMGIDLDEPMFEELVSRWMFERELGSWREVLAKREQGYTDTVATIRDVLSEPRAVLLGHPGTGKSTALRYIAYAIAAGLGDLVGEQVLQRVPILIRLVDYARARADDPTLCLRDYVRDFHDRDRALLFRHALECGECLVMLDGLDEVVDHQQRAEIADQVEALVADYPSGPAGRNQYLVTSRIIGYEAGQLTGDFAHFTLGPLPEESIRGFVQNWYDAIERVGGIEASEEACVRADELCRAIEERPSVRRLAENPLLLTIIALVNWKGRRLPNRRVEVYLHAAETLIESWPGRWRDVSFDAEEVLSLLEPVAYRIFADRSSEEISQGDLLPLLTEACVATKPGMPPADARSFVDGLLPQLSEHSGLFLERGFDEETGQRMFGFLHLTLAEYLAARHLAAQWEAETDDGQRRAFLARYAHVPRWREVLLLMVAHIGLDGRRVPATQAVVDLLQMESPYEEQLHRDLLLAGQCLADDLRVQPKASTWIANQLVSLMLETPIKPLRDEIARLSRAMTNTVYEEALLDQLLSRIDNESYDVRERAAWALGEIGSHLANSNQRNRAVDALQVLLEDADANVRAMAALALGRHKGESIIESLEGCLGDEYVAVRNNAVKALGDVGSDRAVEALLTRLEDEHQWVRISAVTILGEIGGERVIEPLLGRLDDVHEGEGVRARAAIVLAEIDRERTTGELLARLEGKDEQVRERAAWSLGLIRSEQAIEMLLNLTEDSSYKVRARAAWALGAIEDDCAIDGLVDLLTDESDDVRDKAAWALSLIQSERAVEALLARLDDRSESVRRKAITALGQIQSDRAVDALLARLEQSDESVRAEAAFALGLIRDKLALPNLLDALKDESVQVRASAAGALGEIGDAQAVDGLLSLVGDESALVRDRVAWALGRIRSDRATRGLLDLLHDQSEEVRAFAALALGLTKCEQAMSELLDGLSDESKWVRIKAAEALGKLKSLDLIEHLLTWLTWTDLGRFRGRKEHICDWAYITILEILAHHTLDPGTASQSLPQEPTVVGPWQAS